MFAQSLDLLQLQLKAWSGYKEANLITDASKLNIQREADATSLKAWRS